MNMPERTKDGPKARKDLEFLNIRKDLQMPGKRSSEETETETETEDRGKKVNKKEEQYCPPSCSTVDPCRNLEEDRGRSIVQVPCRNQS